MIFLPLSRHVATFWLSLAPRGGPLKPEEVDMGGAVTPGFNQSTIIIIKTMT